MNPEFQRNLWLEAAPRRAAWVAVVLALIYGAVILVARESHVRADIFAGAGVAVFVVCAIFWAGRAAGGSVLTEVAERTWDFQRLSALDAWSMTWGKLFGATLLASCAGMTGIVVYLLFAQPAASPWLVILLLAGALLVQSLSFMAALVGVRKARAEGRVARVGGVLGGLMAGYLLLSSIAASRGLAVLGRGRGLNWLGQRSEIVWWDMVIPVQAFWSIAALIFAGFALAGAWRLMRLELQMRNEPVVWPAFLLFLAIWVAGFNTSPLGHGVSVAAAAAAMCLAAYAAAFVEPADRVALRRFAGLAAQGHAVEAARIAPASLLPLIFALILTLASYGLPTPGLAPLVQSPGGFLAFLVRDLGVIALFRFGPRPQRGDFGAVVALALLYGVGGIFGKTLGGQVGAALFLPAANGFAGVSIVSGLVQAAVVWTLAARRIRAPEVKA